MSSLVKAECLMDQLDREIYDHRHAIRHLAKKDVNEWDDDEKVIGHYLINYLASKLRLQEEREKEES